MNVTKQFRFFIPKLNISLRNSRMSVYTMQCKIGKLEHPIKVLQVLDSRYPINRFHFRGLRDGHLFVIPIWSPQFYSFESLTPRWRRSNWKLPDRDVLWRQLAVLRIAAARDPLRVSDDVNTHREFVKWIRGILDVNIFQILYRVFFSQDLNIWLRLFW